MGHPASEAYGMEPSRPEDYQQVRLDVIRDRWDQRAERWDADLADEHFHLNEDGAYQRFLDAAEAVVTAREEFCRSQLLIDLGCGTGLVLARFIDRFAAGLGVDISPRMLAVAARRDVARTNWLAANCFELARHVTGAGVLLSRGILLSHYGPRQAATLLEQVRQSLSKEGFAILDFLNAASRAGYVSNTDNKAYYQVDEIERLGRQGGFRRVSVLGEPDRRVLLMLAEC
jgi:SAM-dependent methyltransferase